MLNSVTQWQTNTQWHTYTHNDTYKHNGTYKHNDMYTQRHTHNTMKQTHPATYPLEFTQTKKQQNTQEHTCIFLNLITFM